MNSGWVGPQRFRMDAAEQSAVPAPMGARFEPGLPNDIVAEQLQPAIKRTQDYLLGIQAEDGHWCGELEGDTILESEYILLLTYLGRERSERAIQAARYIQQQQLPEGGWAIYPGGPLEVSASVKAYWTLKITGHPVDADYMVRAREAIRKAGGAEKVNSFTRYYFALLGIISYHQCPAVPPEMMLIPSWCPFSIYEMSSWSRTIIVPLTLLWAFRPSRQLPAEMHIDELFVNSPGQLPVTMGTADNLDQMRKRTWINWDRLFRRLDRGIKLIEGLGLKPLRKLAIRRAAEWMQARFEKSDGLGAIFPPIIWSVVALKCLGHSDDSPDVQRALNELERLVIEENGTIRLQPCKSPVWDTANVINALRDSGIPSSHRGVRKAVSWLLAKEVRAPGDWSVRNKTTEPAGWFFEYENQYYPDIDDTIMVVMALSRCLPNGEQNGWQAEYLWNGTSPDPAGGAATILAQRNSQPGLVLAEIEAMRPTLSAIERGVRWVMSMQNRDGGWGAFDVNNDREILTRVPFADHNAMIDPSTPDITARVLEMFGRVGVSRRQPSVLRALELLWATQEPDHCWIGRWGVNYIYGTWQTIVGLQQIGVPMSDERVQRAAGWFKSTQQLSGGWGETPKSYDDPRLRGQGTPTASQTAWALLGLCAAGEADSEAVERGVRYLLDTQKPDGTWDEDTWTGTGFPRVFYLKYHLYGIYFPLMALAHVARNRALPIG